jgi:hypothetical protein
MILKVRTGDGWTFFDGADEINYEHQPEDRLPVLREDATDLRSPESPKKTMIWMWKNRDVIKQIIVNSSTFILTNEGKTIEKIV